MIWLRRAVMIPAADEQGDDTCTSAEWRIGGRLRATDRWAAVSNKRPFTFQTRAVAPQPARKLPGQSLVSRAGGALTTPRSPGAMALGFGLLVALSVALHLQIIATSTGAAYDIQSYAIQAASVLRHQNVYDVTKRYPYPPVWIWIVTLTRLLATATQSPERSSDRSQNRPESSARRPHDRYNGHVGGRQVANWWRTGGSRTLERFGDV